MWLEDVIENSEKAVDSGWTVVVDPDDETIMIIDSDQTPFKITAVAGEEITYLAFVTNLELKGIDADALAPAMRAMLVKNREVDFVKFCLMGDDDTVMLRTDLFSQHMNKDGFNMALEYLILLGRWLIAEIEKSGHTDETMRELEKLSAAALLRGMDPDDVRDNLIKAGVGEVKAMETISHLIDILSIQVDEGDEGLVTIAEVPKKRRATKGDAVDKYIW